MAGRSFRTTLMLATPLALGVAAASAVDPLHGALKLRSVTILTDGTAMTVPERLAAPPLERGGAALVQFRESATPAARRKAVESVGGTFGPYVPDGGALVLLPQGADDALRARPEVRFVIAYAPAWKIDPAVAAAQAGTPLLVSLHAWADQDATRSAIEAGGASVVEVPSEPLSDPTWKVDLSAAADPAARMTTVEAIARIPGVRWIEPVVEALVLNDRSRWIVQTNQQNFFKIHDHGIRGGGQILAGMDSGLDKNHCCFAGRRVDAYTAFGSGDREDGCSLGHGTHVFGTAGCTEPAGLYDGVAPEIHFVVQDIQGSGLQCGLGAVGPPSDLRDAFSAAYSRGARVHTNSWGGGGNSYATDSQQIDDFMWTHQDFLILFAAGNSGGGANAGSISNEASAKNSVTVGGTQSAFQQEYLYGSTSKGPTQGGRRKPEVTAPATGSPEVTSADNGTACGFLGLSGTSMATPAVAGSAILARQYFVDGYWPSGQPNAADGFTPTAALVKAVLIGSADNMAGDFTGSRPNNSQGWGRVHLDNALSFPGDPEHLLILDDRNASTGFASAGLEESYQVFVSDPSQPLRVVLVWTDASAAPGTVDALVNDLDLEVRLRGGIVYAGNAGYSNGWASPISNQPDRVNNNEAVMVASPQAGNATVTVRSYRINDVSAHPQDFALIVVGGASSGPCTAPPPSSIGASVTAARTAGTIRLSWSDTGADHAHVYRSTSPDGFGPGTFVYADSVRDLDPVAAGVQWDDTAAFADGPSYFYLVRSANSCHDETP